MAAGRWQPRTGPVVGSVPVSRFFIGVSRKHRGELSTSFAEVNGEPGLLLWAGELLLAVMTVRIVDGRIEELLSVRNPAKLNVGRPPQGEQ